MWRSAVTSDAYIVILVVMILRYAPRSYLKGLMDTSEEMDNEEEEPVSIYACQAVSNVQTQSADFVVDLKREFSHENDVNEEDLMDLVPSMG
jgi:hypothetical protein